MKHPAVFRAYTSPSDDCQFSWSDEFPRWRRVTGIKVRPGKGGIALNTLTWNWLRPAEVADRCLGGMETAMIVGADDSILESGIRNITKAYDRGTAVSRRRHTVQRRSIKGQASIMGDVASE